jgi:hypothetical protein
MGMTPACDPGPGKTDSDVGKIETSKNKPKKGKSIHLVPPGNKTAPQKCAGSGTWDHGKRKPGLVEKISDPQDLAIFNQSRGKTKKGYLLHLTSTV